MNKQTKIFAGALILISVCCTLCISAMIYIVSDDMEITPYFFQTGKLSDERVGIPVPVICEAGNTVCLSEESFKIKFLQKFITEAFYVLPDTRNVELRTNTSTSTLYNISSHGNRVGDTLYDAYQYWSDNIAPGISKLADAGGMRVAEFIEISPKKENVEYQVLTYRLTTWDRSNDWNAVPTVETKKMSILFFCEPKYKPGIDIGIEYKNLLNQSSGASTSAPKDVVTWFNCTVFDFELHK